MTKLYYSEKQREVQARPQSTSEIDNYKGQRVSPFKDAALRKNNTGLGFNIAYVSETKEFIPFTDLSQGETAIQWDDVKLVKDTGGEVDVIVTSFGVDKGVASKIGMPNILLEDVLKKVSWSALSNAPAHGKKLTK